VVEVSLAETGPEVIVLSGTETGVLVVEVLLAGMGPEFIVLSGTEWGPECLIEKLRTGDMSAARSLMAEF